MVESTPLLEDVSGAAQEAANLEAAQEPLVDLEAEAAEEERRRAQEEERRRGEEEERRRAEAVEAARTAFSGQLSQALLQAGKKIYEDTSGQHPSDEDFLGAKIAQVVRDSNVYEVFGFDRKADFLLSALGQDPSQPSNEGLKAALEKALVDTITADDKAFPPEEKLPVLDLPWVEVAKLLCQVPNVESFADGSMTISEVRDALIGLVTPQDGKTLTTWADNGQIEDKVKEVVEALRRPLKRHVWKLELYRRLQAVFKDDPDKEKVLKPEYLEELQLPMVWDMAYDCQMSPEQVELGIRGSEGGWTGAYSFLVRQSLIGIGLTSSEASALMKVKVEEHEKCVWEKIASRLLPPQVLDAEEWEAAFTRMTGHPEEVGEKCLRKLKDATTNQSDGSQVLRMKVWHGTLLGKIRTKCKDPETGNEDTEKVARMMPVGEGCSHIWKKLYSQYNTPSQAYEYLADEDGWHTDPKFRKHSEALLGLELSGAFLIGLPITVLPVLRFGTLYGLLLGAAGHLLLAALGRITLVPLAHLEATSKVEQLHFIKDNLNSAIFRTLGCLGRGAFSVELMIEKATWSHSRQAVFAAAFLWAELSLLYGLGAVCTFGWHTDPIVGGLLSWVSLMAAVLLLSKDVSSERICGRVVLVLSMVVSFPAMAFAYHRMGDVGLSLVSAVLSIGLAAAHLHSVWKELGLPAGSVAVLLLLVLLVTALIVNPIKMLDDAQVEIPNLFFWKSPRNATDALLGVPHPMWPTVEHLTEFSKAERATRASFYLSSMALTALTCLALGTVAMSFPPSRSRGNSNQLPPSALRQLTRVVVLGFVLLCLKMTISAAFSGTLSPNFGLDYEEYAVLFFGGFLWHLLQAGYVSWRRPCIQWPAGTFATCCFTGLMPFLSDTFDTLKDAMFTALALSGTSWLSRAVGVLSCIWLIVYHVYATHKEELALELQLSFLTVLTAQVPVQVTGDAPVSRWQQAFDKVSWALYSQTRKARVLGVCLEDLPQTFLALVLCAANPHQVQPIVLLLNVALPLAKLTFAWAAHQWLASLVVEQLRLRFEVAYQNGLKESAEEWLKELEPALRQLADTEREQVNDKLRHFLADAVVDLSRILSEESCGLLDLARDSRAILARAPGTTCELGPKVASKLAEVMKGSTALEEVVVCCSGMSKEDIEGLITAATSFESVRFHLKLLDVKSEMRPGAEERAKEATGQGTSRRKTRSQTLKIDFL